MKWSLKPTCFDIHDRRSETWQAVLFSWFLFPCNFSLWNLSFVSFLVLLHIYIYIWIAVVAQWLRSWTIDSKVMSCHCGSPEQGPNCTNETSEIALDKRACQMTQVCRDFLKLCPHSIEKESVSDLQQMLSSGGQQIDSGGEFEEVALCQFPEPGRVRPVYQHVQICTDLNSAGPVIKTAPWSFIQITYNSIWIWTSVTKTVCCVYT